MIHISDLREDNFKINQAKCAGYQQDLSEMNELHMLVSLNLHCDTVTDLFIL